MEENRLQEQLQPINGQKVCHYAKKPFGWLTMGENGCVILAIYNALLRSGWEASVEEIHGILNHPLQGRLCGVRTGELRACLRKLKIPFEEVYSPRELERRMGIGSVAVVMRWNRVVPYCDFTVGTEPLSVVDYPDPFGGGHGVALERIGPRLWRVYNRYSSRGRACDYGDFWDYMGSRSAFMSAFLIQKAKKDS